MRSRRQRLRDIESSRWTSKVEQRQLPGGGMHLGFTMENEETDPDEDIRVHIGW